MLIQLLFSECTNCYSHTLRAIESYWLLYWLPMSKQTPREIQEILSKNNLILRDGEQNPQQSTSVKSHSEVQTNQVSSKVVTQNVLCVPPQTICYASVTTRLNSM